MSRVLNFVIQERAGVQILDDKGVTFVSFLVRRIGEEAVAGADRLGTKTTKCLTDSKFILVQNDLFATGAVRTRAATLDGVLLALLRSRAALANG